MIDLSTYHDQPVAIYGAGPAGLAAFRALYSAGAHVYIWAPGQKRREKIAEAGINPVHPSDWPWDELAFVMPDLDASGRLSLNHPLFRKAAAHKLRIVSDIDLLAEALQKLPEGHVPQIIGITGSHGKTVTSSIVAHVLQQAGRHVFHAGEAGKPALSIDEVHPAQVIVMDLPASKLAFTGVLHCDAAVMLNLTTADVTFFKSPEQYVRAASRVFRNQHIDNALIIGADDTVCQKICTALSSNLTHDVYGSENIIPVSGEATLGQGVFMLGGRIYDARHGKTLEIGDTIRAPVLRSGHFDQNIAAVYAACTHLGMSPATVSLALRTWRGLPGRMHTLGEQDNITVIDDSQSRTLRSTVTGLKNLQNVFWVGGGRKAPSDMQKLREAESSVCKAFFFGAAAESMQAKTRHFMESGTFETPREAINRAITEATIYTRDYGMAAATVLISPGCVSSTRLGTADLVPGELPIIKEGAAA